MFSVMGDAGAARVMAEENDLEFVDLDTYGVDPAAGALLPASLSREHHVVVLKRRFGTPVIATADPSDRSIQTTLRDTIGRDFISVVASRIRSPTTSSRCSGHRRVPRLRGASRMGGAATHLSVACCPIAR